MNESVSNRQIFCYILLSLVGVTVITLPNIMAVNAGTGAWFTLALSTLLFMVPTAALATLNRMFPGQTLYQYARLLVGKPIAVVFAALYCVYFLGIFAFITRLAAEVVKADFLFFTPLPVIIFVLVATSLYVTSRGLSNIGRVLEMEAAFVLAVFLLLHTIMFFNGDKYNMLPLYNPSKTVDYLHAIPITVPAFLGFEALTVLPFQRNNLRRGRLYALLAVALAGIIYIFITESCYSIVGIDDLKNYDDALVVAIRRIDAPYLEVFRRVDLFFLMAWLMSILSTLSVYNFGFHSIAGSLFLRAGKWPVMLVLGAVAFAIGVFPSCYQDAQTYFSLFLYTLAPFTAVLVPALLLIMTRIRKDVVPQSR